MPRSKRPLDRSAGAVRDASLIVIASEDTHAVEQYFSRFRTTRVQFKVLRTEGGHSSPAHVMERLDEFRREYDTQPGDQFWFCIDRDHWVKPSHIGNLQGVLQQCRQKGYEVAISNPCFELWMLLHFRDLDFAPSNCTQVRQRLDEIAHGYDRAKCCGALQITEAMVHEAIARSEQLETVDPLQSPGSGVYRIMNELLKRDRISFL